MKKSAIFLSLLLAVQLSTAQSTAKFKKQFKKSINEIRKSDEKKIISAYVFKDYITVIPDDILKILPEYEADTLVNVRRLIYEIYYQIGRKNSDKNIRQEAVLKLVNACNDKNYDLRKISANQLKYFKKDDFSQKAKNILTEQLSKTEDYYKNTVRLTGFLDMQEQIPLLYELLNDTTIRDPKTKWQIHLTLARLGETDETAYCTNLARSKGVNDRIIHFLLSDLVYTRQKQAFNYLIEILNSQEKNCRPANPHIEDAIVCGYRIMELLAPVIKDFPFETYPGTSQLKAKDYDKALQEVRQWFKNNPDYEIKKDTF
ncbi:MAG: hypothetical protein GXO50_03665 [Chlorobi bacterium]|nr:hypothetical protein [Chlorobiota bacterium]